MDKAELRLQMLNQRNTLSALEILDGSKALCQLLIQLPVYKKSRVILSYMPYGKEANVMPINQRILEDGKTLLIPRVKNATEMDAVPIDALDSGLVEGAYGIREPDPQFHTFCPHWYLDRYPPGNWRCDIEHALLSGGKEAVQTSREIRYWNHRWRGCIRNCKQRNDRRSTHSSLDAWYPG